MFRIGKEFPLWTAVCVPFYTSHPTTSYCERIFGEIKNEVFKNYPLPQRIDNFIKIHLRDLIGGTRSFSSKMQNFIVNKKTLPTWKQKEIQSHTKEGITKLDDILLHIIYQRNILILNLLMIQICYQKRTGVEKRNLYLMKIKKKQNIY